MCCGIPVVITFLRDEGELRAVDPSFRPLVLNLHRIPFCATFGVSCAGHLDIDPESQIFWPKIIGSLNIIAVPREPHVPLLFDHIRKVIGEFSDITFEKTNHVFGPPAGNPVEVWKISVGDAGVLAPLGKDYFFDNVAMAGHSEVLKATYDRHEQVELFWAKLGKEVWDFAMDREFRRMDIRARAREIEEVWYGKEDYYK